MIIRRIQTGDAEAVSALIEKTLRVTNSGDYSPEYIGDLVAGLRPQDILERAEWMHFYVVCKGGEEEADGRDGKDGGIIGCGAIGPFWGKTDESSLFNLFVLPEYQGRGIGRKIVQTLEEDEYARRANRIEVPASITAVPFYRRLGYDYKSGIAVPDEEGLLRLEKLRGSPGCQEKNPERQLPSGVENPESLTEENRMP